jgi:hypothetical protein
MMTHDFPDPVFRLISDPVASRDSALVVLGIVRIFDLKKRCQFFSTAHDLQLALHILTVAEKAEFFGYQ